MGEETSSPQDLEQVTRMSTITETDTNSKFATFSQRATEFLEKFDKRKYNQLMELSAITV